MKRYRIVVRAFFDRERSPFLTHIFAGKSKRAAEELFAAHLEQDVALRAILKDGTCGGGACSATVWMEDVVTAEQEDIELDEG